MSITKRSSVHLVNASPMAATDAVRPQVDAFCIVLALVKSVPGGIPDQRMPYS